MGEKLLAICFFVMQNYVMKGFQIQILVILLYDEYENFALV